MVSLGRKGIAGRSGQRQPSPQLPPRSSLANAWGVRGALWSLDEIQQMGVIVAERVGFEPTVEFPLHSLSRRALSTAQTPLRGTAQHLIVAERRDFQQLPRIAGM